MISDLSLLLSLNLTLSKTVQSGAWPDATQGENTVATDLLNLDLDVWNLAYISSIPVEAGTTETIDLQNFTSLLEETGQTMTKVLLMIVQVTADDPALTDVELVVSPGAADGLVWFYGSGVSLKNNDTLIHTGNVDSAGEVVDATHKTIDLENLGTNDLTASVVIVGGS